MSEKQIYPKVTERVSNVAEEIADVAIFNGMATGVLKGLHAAKNTGTSHCIGDKALNECEAVREAMRSTLEIMPEDDNEDFSGWVGYEQANATCQECNSGCSARVMWQDGLPTEKMKFLFYEKSEPDAVIHIDTDKYRS